MLLTKLKDNKYKTIITNIRYKKNVFNTLYKHFEFKNPTTKIIFSTTKNFNYYIKKIYKIVSYIVSLKISKNNIIFNISDIKGFLLVNNTTGKLGFKGKHKNKKFSMLSLLKSIYYNYNFLKNQPIILKLKGFKYYNKLIIKKLKEKFFIKLLIYDKSTPHNGCRPKKKIRR